MRAALVEHDALIEFLTAQHDGRVVGYAGAGAAAGPGSHAVLWDRGRIVDLGAPAGHLTSAANKINGAGQAVGNALVGAVPPAGPPAHGFLWQLGAWLDLNDLIPADSGWELRGAADINAAGQIVGPG
jgi:uncharacterized membrane protein